MNLAVCVKEVLDSRLPLRVTPRTGEISQSAPAPITLMNPSDRAALEVALLLRDETADSRVSVFSVCEAHSQGALQFALARGADRVERIVPDPEHATPVHTSLLLANRFREEHFDLICCGDETLDNASAVVGPVLAELLELPQVTGIGRVREQRGGRLLVERCLDRGDRELVELELPGLISLQAGAAEPRYVSLRRIEQAQQKPIPSTHLDLDGLARSAPQWAEEEKRVPPRARVKRKFAPSAKLPAAERVKLIMSGGMSARAQAQDSSVLEGAPEELSEQLFRFLKHHEYL